MTINITNPNYAPTPKQISAFGGWCPLVDAARANTTIWIRRISVPTPCTVSGVYFLSGANGTGDLAVGLYAAQSATTATGSLLLASGVAAQGGSYGLPAGVIPFTANITIPAGEYYLAIQTENSTQTLLANPQWAAPIGVSQTVTRAYDATMPETLGTAADSATNITLALRTV